MVRYHEGGHHLPHIDECVVHDADTISLQTCMVYLRHDAAAQSIGSSGEFVLHDRSAKVRRFRPNGGDALLLQHDVLHSAEPIRVKSSQNDGTGKVILRSDILIQRIDRSASESEMKSVKHLHQARQMRAVGCFKEASEMETNAYKQSAALANYRFGYKIPSNL